MPLRLLLLMILLLVILVALALGALFAWRSFGSDISGKSVVKDSINSGPNPQVRISNPRGSIRVEGVNDLQSVEFEVTKYAIGSDEDEARRRASEVTSNLSRDGSVFVIEADERRGTGADYTLRIPEDGSVEVESGAGDVSVNGVEGDVRVSAEAGDVTVSETRGSAYVEAQQGDVEISDVRTDAGRAEVEVGVGDLEIENLVVGTLDARVGTGDVILSGRFSGDGVVLVQTGDVVVEVPPEDTAELELKARIGDVVRQNGGG